MINKNKFKKFESVIHSLRITTSVMVLLMINVSNAQTIGATFGVHSSSTGANLMQSIGQPFAVFQKMEESGTGKNTLQMSQGHILPFDQNSSVTEKLSFKTYPNPVKDILTVSLDNRSSIIGVTIMDMNGRIIQNDMSTNGNRAEIDMQGFTAGIYLVNVTDENGIRGVVKVTKIGQSID
jgi:hypothetical protein